MRSGILAADRMRQGPWVGSEDSQREPSTGLSWAARALSRSWIAPRHLSAISFSIGPRRSAPRQHIAPVCAGIVRARGTVEVRRESRQTSTEGRPMRLGRALRVALLAVSMTIGTSAVATAAPTKDSSLGGVSAGHTPKSSGGELRAQYAWGCTGAPGGVGAQVCFPVAGPLWVAHMFHPSASITRAAATCAIPRTSSDSRRSSTRGERRLARIPRASRWSGVTTSPSGLIWKALPRRAEG
jgi:hypothetical protein